MSKRDNIIKWSIISIFVGLYAMVSIISTIHVIDFFRLSNPEWLAITLAIAFEVGAAASLGAIIILDKTSKAMVWMLFVLITGMQMMGNMYYAFTHVENYTSWIELFGLVDDEPVTQKRILSIVSGAILPIVALGFIKSLVDYIKPNTEKVEETVEEVTNDIDKKEIESKVMSEVADEVELRDEAIEVADEIEDEDQLDDVMNNDVEDLTDDKFDNVIEEIKEIKETSENPNKDIERKIAKVIASNPELKEKLNIELKKMENGDTYTKKESSDIANVNSERRTFGGM